MIPAAIQAAINCCGANGGGMVYMPAGTYLIGMGTNTGVNMASYVSLVGSGIGATTILRPPAIEQDQSNIVFNIYNCTNAQLQNINFQTDLTDPSYISPYTNIPIANGETLVWRALDCATLFQQSNGCSVSNCSMSGFRSCIQVRGPSTADATNTDNTFENIIFNNMNWVFFLIARKDCLSIIYTEVTIFHPIITILI